MSRTVIKEYTLYNYSELSDKAKERVKEWYLQGQDGYIFASDVNDDLRNLFPDSTLSVSFQLSYCQGDYLDIEGRINLEDLYSKIKDNFDIEECKFFEWLFKEFGGYNYDLNNYTCSKYSYSGTYFMNDLINKMVYLNYRDIRYDLLSKFDSLASTYLDKLCSDYMQDGYSFFYEIDDDVLSETCDINEWLFLEDGTFWH